ncbi:MAG: response regulator [Planctomycetaceae bacterium]|jgi:DNA-binding NarL/FixJ family response regulator
MSVNDPARQILIIDQQGVARIGLRQLLEQEEGVQVCGEASETPGALHLLKSTSPDAIILDLEWDGAASGLDLIQRIRSVNKQVPILVYSMLEDLHYIERALSAGARGFCSKREPPAIVVEGLRQVLAGNLFLNEGIASQLLTRSIGDRHATDGSYDPTVQGLSNRELEVFALIGRGYKTVEIARALKLSIKTIETHRLRIRDKLSLADSAKLAFAAVRWVQEHQADGPRNSASPTNETLQDKPE